jgi:predicted secreted protein
VNRIKVYLLLAILSLSFLIAGNVPSKEKEAVKGFIMPEIVIIKEDAGKTLKAIQGNRILIRLNENPSTGYQWKIDLSDEQQERLLKVRQETMKEVRAIKPQIKTLVEKIKTLTQKNEKIEKIMPLVQEVATLKAHATEVQLICLAKSKEILTDKQLEFLSKR